MEVSPFDLVSQNLQRLGALTISEYLASSAVKSAPHESQNVPVQSADDPGSRSPADTIPDVINPEPEPETSLPQEISTVEPPIDPNEDAGVLQIEQACAGKTTPRWIFYTNREVQINPVLCYGAALHISGTTPHTGQIYCTDTLFPTESEAKSACATLALSSGVLSYIQHATHPLPQPVMLATPPSSPLTLQQFYESLPRPFPSEDGGDKTAAEINAPPRVNTIVNTSGGARLRSMYHWQTDPTSGLVGCLLRLARPFSASTHTPSSSQIGNKAYVVSPIFLKRADAKAAVCLLALSLDVTAHIRAAKAAAADTYTNRMASRVYGELSRLKMGNYAVQWAFEGAANTHRCTLTVNVGTPGMPHTRTYTVPPEHRTKADAKAAVACLAAEQGVVEFMRFRGAPPPPANGSHKTFWERIQAVEREGMGAGVGGKRKEREGDVEDDEIAGKKAIGGGFSLSLKPNPPPMSALSGQHLLPLRPRPTEPFTASAGPSTPRGHQAPSLPPRPMGVGPTFVGAQPRLPPRPAPVVFGGAQRAGYPFSNTPSSFPTRNFPLPNTPAPTGEFYVPKPRNYTYVAPPLHYEPMRPRGGSSVHRENARRVLQSGNGGDVHVGYS
ncbi:hypothetical protein Hypma_014004 [Hypsizygus marmoreus]|uniref:Uncharacterized protein n=1 Tax=Hypsizygus marmoreus TaxID=39966 RepID=A0A369KB59_HYPMA|nr:hypothetical protein Hypma_014004 [Hypsizygus marmoreus]